MEVPAASAREFPEPLRLSTVPDRLSLSSTCTRNIVDPYMSMRSPDWVMLLYTKPLGKGVKQYPRQRASRQVVRSARPHQHVPVRQHHSAIPNEAIPDAAECDPANRISS